MKKSLMLVFLLSLLAFSCAKDEIKINSDNLLIGVWDYSDYQNNADVYKRSLEFIDNHCYKFNDDGTLIERKNAGWCGTPPISYADYSGNWSIINDTLIQIKVGYWGGTTTYKLDIESVSIDALKIVFIPLLYSKMESR
jgi:hypothetical protein